MSKHLRYLKYVILHKYYVFKAGRVLGGIPLWRLIIHDYSKFSRAEWTPYVNRFFSDRAGIEDKTLDPDEFIKAWNHHWRKNPHHWEYWITANSKPMRMPDHFAREMIADWLGAGKGITGKWDLTEWYEKTKEKQWLHPDTKGFVEAFMDYRIKEVVSRLEKGRR